MRLLALLPLLTSAALAASSAPDVLRTSDTVAQLLDGTIRPCPAPFKAYGTPARQCVGVDLSAKEVRAQMSGSVKFAGAWRASNDPNYVYNWIVLPSGYVTLFLGADPAQLQQSLLYLDVHPLKASTPAASTPQPSFKRVLKLTAPRMNGEDIRALQNRLMDVSRVPRGQGGDGWYGPVTEANVIAFQSTNGLVPTGVVDRATWERLFSKQATYFSAELAKAIAKRHK